MILPPTGIIQRLVQMLWVNLCDFGLVDRSLVDDDMSSLHVVEATADANHSSYSLFVVSRIA